jgi:hypothetical protein
VDPAIAQLISQISTLTGDRDFSTKIIPQKGFKLVFGAKGRLVAILSHDNRAFVLGADIQRVDSLLVATGVTQFHVLSVRFSIYGEFDSKTDSQTITLTARYEFRINLPEWAQTVDGVFIQRDEGGRSAAIYIDPQDQRFNGIPTLRGVLEAVFEGKAESVERIVKKFGDGATGFQIEIEEKSPGNTFFATTFPDQGAAMRLFDKSESFIPNDLTNSKNIGLIKITPLQRSESRIEGGLNNAPSRFQPAAVAKVLLTFFTLGVMAFSPVANAAQIFEQVIGRSLQTAEGQTVPVSALVSAMPAAENKTVQLSDKWLAQLKQRPNSAIGKNGLGKVIFTAADLEMFTRKDPAAALGMLQAVKQLNPGHPTIVVVTDDATGIQRLVLGTFLNGKSGIPSELRIASALKALLLATVVFISPTQTSGWVATQPAGSVAVMHLNTAGSVHIAGTFDFVIDAAKLHPKDLIAVSGLSITVAKALAVVMGVPEERAGDLLLQVINELHAHAVRSGKGFTFMDLKDYIQRMVVAQIIETMA